MTLPAQSSLDARKIAEAAHPVFVAQGWTYGGRPGDRAAFVPSIDALEETITGLLAAAAGFDGDGTCSTGRFHVDRETEDGDIHYSVVLDLTEVGGDA